MDVDDPQTILLVENDPDIRNLLLTVFRDKGFTAFAVDGSQKAVEWYSQHSAETGLVVLEANMSPVDGATTLALLRFLNPKLPAIFIAGALSPSVTEQLLALGNTQVLMKPFGSLDQLTAAARRGMEAARFELGAPPPGSLPATDKTQSPGAPSQHVGKSHFEA